MYAREAFALELATLSFSLRGEALCLALLCEAKGRVALSAIRRIIVSLSRMEGSKPFHSRRTLLRQVVFPHRVGKLPHLPTRI